MTVTGDILPLAHVLVPGPVSRDHQVIINKVILVTLIKELRLKTVTLEANYTMITVFVGQFINTAVLIVLNNASFKDSRAGRRPPPGPPGCRRPAVTGRERGSGRGNSLPRSVSPAVITLKA